MLLVLIHTQFCPWSVSLLQVVVTSVSPSLFIWRLPCDVWFYNRYNWLQPKSCTTCPTNHLLLKQELLIDIVCTPKFWPPSMSPSLRLSAFADWIGGSAGAKYTVQVTPAFPPDKQIEKEIKKLLNSLYC